MSARPHWTRLGLTGGRCSRPDCATELPMAPDLCWWDGEDLKCRDCAEQEGAEFPALEILE